MRYKKREESEFKRRLSVIEKLLASIADKLERSHFYEYTKYVSDEKRIFRRSFLTGLLKGAGSAIGFTVLGAIVIYFLHAIAMSNLPYIADFIADIIEIIKDLEGTK